MILILSLIPQWGRMPIMARQVPLGTQKAILYGTRCYAMSSESRKTKWLIALFKSMTKTVTKMVLPLRHYLKVA